MPLYPQYAAATTATACDQAFRALMKMRWQPAVRVAPPYHDDPVYIDALADLDPRAPRRARLRAGGDPRVLPRHAAGATCSTGDPYHCQCQKTGAAAARGAGLARPSASASRFQSRFGNDEWLQPYTDETVERAGARPACKRLAVVAPGFSADCLETLEEIDMREPRRSSSRNGGEKFAYVPCLNDSEDGMRVIEAVVRRELMGWV